jgi:hypothetical protein
MDTITGVTLCRIPSGRSGQVRLDMGMDTWACNIFDDEIPEGYRVTTVLKGDDRVICAIEIR